MWKNINFKKMFMNSFKEVKRDYFEFQQNICVFIWNMWSFVDDVNENICKTKKKKTSREAKQQKNEKTYTHGECK